MSKINSQVGTSFNLHIILNIEIPRDRVLSVGKNPRKTEGLVVNKNKSQGRMSFNLNTKVNLLYHHQESDSQSLGRDFPVIAIDERIQIEENDGMRERERAILFFAWRRVLPLAGLRISEPRTPSESHRGERWINHGSGRREIMRTRRFRGQTRYKGRGCDGRVGEDGGEDRRQEV